MARWSLLAALLFTVICARAAAASARLSAGDTKIDRPCVIAATTIRVGVTHLQGPIFGQNSAAALKSVHPHVYVWWMLKPTCIDVFLVL